MLIHHTSPIHKVICLCLCLFLTSAAEAQAPVGQQVPKNLGALIGQLASDDKAVQNQAKGNLLVAGPQVIDSLRYVRQESDRIIQNYEWIMHGTGQQGRAAIAFFSEHKATLFLMSGLKSENLDTTVGSIRALSRLDPEELRSSVPALIQALEAEPYDGPWPRSAVGSHEMTGIQDLYVNELIRLLSAVVGYKTPATDEEDTEKRIKTVISAAKRWLVQNPAKSNK